LIRLIATEIRRASKRRLFRMGLLVGVLLVIAAALGSFFSADRNVESARSRARAEIANCERFATDEAEAFEEREGRPPPDDFFDCGTLDQILPAYDRTFRYAESVGDMVRAGAVLGGIISFLVGASFVGAEWGSGNLATFLTWEPRRAHVHVAKVVAIALCCAVVVTVLLVLLMAVHLPVASLRGTMRGTTADLWRTLAGTAGRGAGLAAMFAAAGAGLAMVMRNTAGAIVVGGVYAAVIDPFLHFWDEGRLRVWTLFRNVPQFMGYAIQRSFEDNVFGGGVEPAVLSVWRPSLLLAAYVAAVIVLGYVAFRARDVT
jgi:ABC-2 type transport system permease protein